ncbi:hypothetical protein [Nonlabens sp.]|uniref:hypothetical protein n=1 Tax=Nonlabens sp. TaxID=1888209 RepID=UPI001BD1AA38|nr:hypothetical protein [Nonlabens sp.]
MRIVAFIILSLFALPIFGQSFSESDIKELANQVNEQIKGVDIGNGITAKGCLALGRTLIYQYDVPDYWEAPSNIKEELISNLKTAGAAKNYFLYDIDVDFYYYKGNSLIKKVSVKSNEFSTYNFELGEYLSIKDHIKSKDVNLKLKVPQGWEVKEGDRPNIVKKFTKDGNTYLILIKDNMTFFSRSESKELLSDKSFVNEFVEESSSFMKNSGVIDKSVVTIDTYPSVTFKVRGKMERSGITIPMIMRCWVVFYEDKIVFLQSMGIDNAEFKALEQLYFLITNSVIFPDQYN